MQVSQVLFKIDIVSVMLLHSDNKNNKDTSILVY